MLRILPGRLKGIFGNVLKQFKLAEISKHICSVAFTKLVYGFWPVLLKLLWNKTVIAKFSMITVTLPGHSYWDQAIAISEKF